MIKNLKVINKNNTDKIKGVLNKISKYINFYNQLCIYIKALNL